MTRIPRPRLISLCRPALLTGLLLAIVLSACQAGGQSQVTPPPLASSRLPEASQPAASLTVPEATLVMAGTRQPTDLTAAVTPLTTAASDPLRFVFPTPGPGPVSAWRPPLYPVPWAPVPFDHFYFARPIAADEVNWPVADYRYGGAFFENIVHTGVDIPAPEGTPVLAAGAGRVVWAGYGVYRGGRDTSDPYGLAVTIRHDFGYENQVLYTIYGHMRQIDVAEGQHVETGDQIGLVGETGNVTGPHLHFEVRLGENSFFTTRNPELWIVPPLGWGVLAGRIMDTSGVLVPNQPIIITNPRTGQNWFARSYGPDTVNSDPYYQENLVVGDLPAGVYELRTAYVGFSHKGEIEVRPGLVSYFTFRGWDGFSADSPPPPGADFTPAPFQPSP